MARVVAVGSALRDRLYSLTNLPEPDGGAFARDERTAFGGVAANVACGLDRLGHDVAVVARLGDDADGRAVRADLEDRGVADGVRLVEGERSSYTMILRAPDGERMIVAGGESVPNLRLTDADRERLRAADVALTSAYAPDAVVADLVAMRREGELSGLAFDLAGPLEELVDRGTTPETIDDAVTTADLTVLGTVAAASYLDCTGAPAARELAARGAARVAVTAGDEGAVLAGRTVDGVVDVPAIPVETVDATGAGDAFFAGLIDAWLWRGDEPAAAGRFASAAAALNCRGEGARGALPDREAVAALLADRD